MEIKISVKNVYGRELVYPVCDTAKLLAQLTGRQTFRLGDLGVIRKLGYTVNQVPDTIINQDSV